MSTFSVDYTPREIIDPITRKVKTIYDPMLDILISGRNNMKSRPITFMVDSGADFNIFPSEIAFKYLGMTKKALKKGKKLPLAGIAEIQLLDPAYGHKVTLQHPYFKLDTWVFFLENQRPPLLGKDGFMNLFKRIEFNETKKKMVFEL